MTDVSVLRIRPIFAQRQGPVREQFRDIAEAVSENTINDIRVYTFDLPLSTKSWAETVPAAAGLAQDMLNESDVMIVDVSFNLDLTSQGVVDLFVKDLFEEMWQHIRESHRLLLLVDREFYDIDGIGQLQTDVRFVRKLLVVNTSDGTYNSSHLAWNPGYGLPAAVRVRLGRLREQVAARVVRRRGAFLDDRTSMAPRAFRYSAESTKEDVQTLLENWVSVNGVECLVFDDISERWFQDLVQQVGDQQSIPVYASSFIEMAASSHRKRKAVTALQETLRSALAGVILPMYDTGKRAGHISQLISSMDGRSALFAVMARLREEQPFGVEDGFLKITPLQGDVRVRVDFLAKIDVLAESSLDWLLEKAVDLRMTEDPLSDWSMPSMVAMWSLLSELGSELEEPVPRSRPRVVHFPRLRQMEPDDTLWLAESLVRVAERNVASSFVPRSQIFFVIPAEVSGAERLGKTMSELLDVAVLRISRIAIEDHSKLSRSNLTAIRQNSDRAYVVVVDESALTFKTLESLTSILRKHGKQPSLSLTIVESNFVDWITSRPRNLTSFYSLARHAQRTQV